MLLQVAIENFKSIADKVVLSFLAVEGEDHPAGQVVDVPGVGGVLRSIVIYGANASGKSTLVEALATFRRLALHGVRPEGRLPWLPNRLNLNFSARPTTVEVEMIIAGVRHAYGLVYTSDRVVREWMVRVERDSDSVMFERTGARIEFGPALSVSAERTAFLRFVAEGTRPEQVLLAELRDRGAVEFEGVHELLRSLTTVRPHIGLDEPELVVLAEDDPTFLGTIGALLAEAGTGVESVALEGANPLATERVSMRFAHLDSLGEQTLFTIGQLSDGTRRLIDVGFYLHHRSNALLVVDELDRSLHTQLTKWLVARWNANMASGQAIFTTHDTNLLDAKLFGRDAIWFVEKDRAGASHFYSLVEFDREQLDQLTGRIEDGYLQGRFGAVPFAGDPTRMGWAKP